MITQSRRALEYLPPDNLLSRLRANWTMGMAYFFRGERAAAGRAFAEALSIAQASGDIHNTLLATTSLGQIQELENQLYLAAEQSVRQYNFVHRIPEVAAAQVLTLLRHGDVAAAAHLAQTHLLPISQARVHIAQGDTSGDTLDLGGREKERGIPFG